MGLRPSNPLNDRLIMFQETCKSLLNTVLPIVVAWRTRNGKVNWSIGAGAVVNDEGYLVTAGHILQQIAELDKQVTGTSAKNAKKHLQVTHYCSVFGMTGARLTKVFVDANIDLGIAKLEGYVPRPDCTFPRFRKRDIEQGEFLCRAGYPFVEDVKPLWDNQKGFQFTNLFPVPLFVNEALVSRFALRGSSGKWIETSSPGLRGQSGGPLADADGLICGIQVNTAHYPLGFTGKGRNQVLNVGRAVHTENIRNNLDVHNIQYLTEED